MPSLPNTILSLLAHFSQIFTKPTWKHAQVLIVGAIICIGKRTVTSAMQILGLSNEKNFSKYHRVLNKANWNSWRLVKILLGLLLSLVPKSFPILIAMDDTIERRKGKLIKAKGCYRDPCKSTKNMITHCFGLKWQCAALLIKLPWSNRYWGLPFMTVLCKAKTYDKHDMGYRLTVMKKHSTVLHLSVLGYYKNKLYYRNDKNVNVELNSKLNIRLTKNIKSTMNMRKKLTTIRQNIQMLGKKDMCLLTKTCKIRKILHRTSIDYAHLMMAKISKYLKRSWILIGDGGFACVKLGIACHKHNVTLISRLRKDAALYLILST